MKKRILLGAFLFAGSVLGFAKSTTTFGLQEVMSQVESCTVTETTTKTRTVTYPDGSTVTETYTVTVTRQVPCLSTAPNTDTGSNS